MKCRIAVATVCAFAVAVTGWFLLSGRYALPPASNNPNWLKLVERVKNAKRVVTVASFEEPLNTKRILAQTTKPEPGFIVREASDKAEVANFLLHCENQDSGLVAACFCPHQFVIAYGDGPPLLLALCFSCGHIRTYEGEQDQESFWVADVPDSVLRKTFGLGRAPEGKDFPPCGYFNAVGAER